MKTIILTLLLAPVFCLFGQAPDIDWQESYGGNSYDQGRCLIQIADGSFIVGGHGYSFEGDVTEHYGLALDDWFIHISPTADLLWEHNYGGSSWDYATDILEDSGGGYVIIGQTYSWDIDIDINYGQDDGWIIKIDESGNLLWSKTIGGSSNDQLNCILATPDGGYIIAGNTRSSDHDVTENFGFGDMWIVKITEAGEIEWQRSYGGSGTEYANCIIPATGGGYMVAGLTASVDGDIAFNHGAYDFWVIKIAEDGTLLWENTYGGSYDERSYAIVADPLGGYLVAGNSESNDGQVSMHYGAVDTKDLWAIHISSDGELEWERAYGGSGEEGIAPDILVDPLGGFILETYTNSAVLGFHGGNDIWIIRIAPDGEIIWQRPFGGSSDEIVNDIMYCEDGGLMFVGYNESDDGDADENQGSADYWVVKLLPECTENTFYADHDADGFGDSSTEVLACDAPLGFIEDGTDCDDTNEYIYPGAEDICNTIDDNCNGVIDEDAAFIMYYADMDGDAFGDVDADSTSCSMLVGYVLDNTDCDDTDENIYPGAEDICNGLDENCNGNIDEDAIFTWYFEDADGDLYGNIDIDSLSCASVPGYVTDATDCNDLDADINISEMELCNTLDDNCNGFIDEGLPLYTLYIDIDADEFGDPEVQLLSCLNSIPGYVTDSTDCDDSDPNVYPGASELPNGLDDDCNGLIDEHISTTGYASQIKIFPNPASGVLHVENTIGVPLDITIQNTSGQRVFNTIGAGENISIDISGFAAGMYVLFVQTEKASYSKVICKE